MGGVRIKQLLGIRVCVRWELSVRVEFLELSCLSPV
jgi:hypothetical protein